MMDDTYIEEKIKQLEKKLGTQIPQDYKKFLINLENKFLSHPKYEGWENLQEYKVEYLLREKPIPAYHTFHEPNCEWPVLYIINLYSLIEQAPYQLSIANDIFQTDTEGIYRDFLPIADNGCGDVVCVGLRGENRSKIFISAHEQGYKLILLSNSFQEFLTKMTLNKK